MKRLTISAKNLGQLALPEFCPRCFWIKLHVHHKLPFQIFPGIFSSIDGYTKRVVSSAFDVHKVAPQWLADFGKITGYCEPPHYSKFSLFDEQARVTLRGSPDAIFTVEGGSYIVADYKTAKFTPRQDKLLPLYEIQLNAYAYIGQRHGIAPVSRLALIYTEPVTHEEAAKRIEHHGRNGFLMEFSANIQEVALKLGSIPPLLLKVRELYDQPHPPPKRGLHRLRTLGAIADAHFVPAICSPLAR